MGRLVKAYWDCPFCETKQIGGDLRECPNCGRPRGEVKFYMKDNAQEYTYAANERQNIEYVEEEKAAGINRNPDWYCSYCNSLNNDGESICKGCGATREDSEANYFTLKYKQEQKEQELEEQKINERPAEVKSVSKRGIGSLALVLLALAGLLFFLFKPSVNTETVKAVSWTREIDIEQYVNLQESDWHLPEGAELIESKRELHYYDHVLDHYEEREVERSREVLDHYDYSYDYVDLGNGYYEEVEHSTPVYKTEYYTETEQYPVYVDVPVYDTKYYYTIWRWIKNRVASASGTAHDEYWPETALADNERTADTREKYRFTYTSGKKEKEFAIGYDEWRKLSAGDSIKIKSSRAGRSYLLLEDGTEVELER